AKAPFEGREGVEGREGGRSGSPSTALRRYRLPVPVRVQVQDGRPVRVTTDRRGVSGGSIVQAAGPWRTSGEWWNDGIQVPRVPKVPPVPDVHSAPAALAHSCTAPHPVYPAPLSHPSHPSCWDRDEWDIAIADGTIYCLYVERDVGQWFLEGVVD